MDSIDQPTCDKTHGIVNNINTSTISYFEDLFLPVFYGVVNAVICTSVLFTYIKFGLRADCCDYVRAQCLWKIDIRSQLQGFEFTRDLPFASWTAAMPTPPAAAVTRTHSPEAI
jgi:hypothetical protein